jgi:hypothetical protein
MHDPKGAARRPSFLAIGASLSSPDLHSNEGVMQFQISVTAPAILECCDSWKQALTGTSNNPILVIPAVVNGEAGQAGSAS